MALLQVFPGDFQQTEKLVGGRREDARAMSAHKGHRKSVYHDATGNGRYVFVKDIDPGRALVISTLFFDVSEQR
jgi:hypothetical protein